MVYQEETRRNFENNLHRVEEHLLDSNHRVAYQLLSDTQAHLSEHQDEYLDLQKTASELLKRIQTESRERIKQVRVQLETLHRDSAADIGSYDIELAESLLHAWDNALLYEEVDPELDAWWNSFRERRTRTQEYRTARVVQQQVEAKWLEAENLQRTSEDVAPATIAGMYSDALRIAQEAYNSQSSNSYLKDLVERARDRRERAGSVEGIVTSGAQLGEYQRVIDYYKQQPPDTKVPVYRRVQTDQGVSEAFIGNKTVDEALEVIQVEARAYARQKVSEYRETATRYLGALKPRDAMSLFVLVSEEEAAEQSDEIPSNYQKLVDFLEPHDVDRVEELRKKIKEHLDKLEVAEATAREAGVIARADGLRAWRKYQAALNSYKGLVHTSIAENVKRDIVGRLTQELKEILAVVHARYERGDINQVINRIDEVLRLYSDLSPELTVYIRDLEGLRESAISLRDQQADINDKLSLAQRYLAEHTRSATEEAAEMLTDLERRYDASILEQYVDYETLRSQVNQQLDISIELERLEKFKTHLDPVAVERAIRSAEQASHRDNGQIEQRFADMAASLRMHLAFLRAQREVANGQLSAAQERLLEIKDDLRAPDRAEAEDLYQDVTARLDREESISSKIDRAADLMNVRDYRDALNIIDEIPAPSRQADILKIDDLKHQIGQKWFRTMESDLKHLSIVDDVSRHDIEDALEDMEIRLGRSDAADRWRKRLQPILQVADAKELWGAGNYELALERLRSITLEKGKPAEQDYLKSLINRIHANQVEADLITRRDAVKDLVDAKLPTFLTELSELAKSINQLYQVTTLPKHAVWYLEILLMQASLTDSSEKRKRLFDQAYTFASTDTVIQQPIRDDQTLEANRLRQLELAENAPVVVTFMEDVEKNLQANKTLDEIAEGVNIWKVDLQGYKPIFTFLETWYRKLTDQLEKVLDPQLTGIEKGTHIQHLQPLAKLYLINAPLGKRLEQDLPRLSARLDEEISKALQNYPTAVGYENVREPDELLTRQQADLQHYHDNLTLTRKILNDFTQTPLRTISDDINQGRSKQSNKLEDALNKLAGLERDYHTALMDLNAGANGLSGAGQALSRMQINFPAHPATLDIKKKIDTTTLGITSLQQQIELLRELVAKERYEDAQEVLQRIDSAQLVELGISLNIQEPYERVLYNDLASIKQQVEKRLDYLNTVRYWAAPFQHDMRNIQDCSVTPVQAQPQQGRAPSTVVHWNDLIEQIEQMVLEGRFDVAYKFVHQIVYSGYSHYISLEAAIEQAETPVIAAPPRDFIALPVSTDPMQRYQDAIRYAGTLCGRAILQEVLNNCLPSYRQHHRAGLEMMQEIEAIQHDWGQLEEQYKSSLKQLAEDIEKRSYGKLKQHIAQTENIIRSMQKITPQHPLIPEMAYHFILVMAKSLLSKKGSRAR